MGIQELNRENPVRGSKVKAPPAESSTKNDSLRNWTGLRRKATFLGGNQQKEGGGGARRAECIHEVSNDDLSDNAGGRQSL